MDIELLQQVTDRMDRIIALLEQVVENTATKPTPRKKKAAPKKKPAKSVASYSGPEVH